MKKLILMLVVLFSFGCNRSVLSPDSNFPVFSYMELEIVPYKANMELPEDIWDEGKVTFPIYLVNTDSIGEQERRIYDVISDPDVWGTVYQIGNTFYYKLDNDWLYNREEGFVELEFGYVASRSIKVLARKSRNTKLNVKFYE